MGAHRREALKTDFEALLATIKEIEALLQFPGEAGHIDKANLLAMRIARTAGEGPIANLAMKAIGEANKLRTDPADRSELNHALWHLRIAVQEAKSRSNP
jgi:hypothetical protein